MTDTPVQPDPEEDFDADEPTSTEPVEPEPAAEDDDTQDDGGAVEPDVETPEQEDTR